MSNAQGGESDGRSRRGAGVVYNRRAARSSGCFSSVVCRSGIHAEDAGAVTWIYDSHRVD
jgi:hypothetical protein